MCILLYDCIRVYSKTACCCRQIKEICSPLLYTSDEQVRTAVLVYEK